MVENYGDSQLAKRFGVKRYPAIFVDDVLVATPKDFGWFGKGEGKDEGRYAPLKSAASHERFRSDLARMLRLVARGRHGGRPAPHASPCRSSSARSAHELARGAVGDDRAAVEHDRARAQRRHEREVVARDHERRGEPAEQLAELAAAARVEARGRLVEQQQPRPARERAREAQPPLLAAAQVVREALLAARRARPPRAPRARPRPRRPRRSGARAVRSATSSPTVRPTIWSSGSSNTMPTRARSVRTEPGSSVTPSISTRPCTSWRWAGAAGSWRCR